MYKTYQLKLKNPDNEYFGRLFAEAKWYYNHILSSDDIFKFDTKTKIVGVLIKDGIEERKCEKLAAQMRQNIHERICSAIKGLAAAKKKGYKIGKLKFTSEVNSIPLSNQTFVIKNRRVRFTCNKKSFRLLGLEQLPEGQIKSAEIIRNTTGIFLHVVVELLDSSTLISGKLPVIGVDFGIASAFTFSDGCTVNTDFLETIKLINKRQRQLSKKVKCSKNWLKAKAALNKAYIKIGNQKKDAANKLLNKLNNFQVCFQDEMLDAWQAGRFGRKISNGILGRVKTGLSSNPNHHKVPKSLPTTKSCPQCGTLNAIPLSQRLYACGCGYSMSRDKHSARNMIIFGTGQANVEKEIPVFDSLKTIECKFLSVKQEAGAY